VKPRCDCRLLLPLLPAALGGLLLGWPAPPGLSAPAPVAAKGRPFANSIGMKFVLIPRGKFTMGSPPSEPQRREEEYPHEVEITKPFSLGVYEVTQAQYQKVVGTNPSWFSAAGGGKDQVRGMDTGNFPVEQVDHAEATAFCRKLSELPRERAAGRVYRLPSEAEWEYACRAGTKTPFHFGKEITSRLANMDGTRPYGTAVAGAKLNRTTTVGSYKPNAWGLYDMHGNVWEWVADWWDQGYYRVSPKRDPQGPEKGTTRNGRGGGWNTEGMRHRAAFRGFTTPTVKNSEFGFRVVCVRGKAG
jgi:formylglycine-generating enzyme required for sulfatase activity